MELLTTARVAERSMLVSASASAVTLSSGAGAGSATPADSGSEVSLVLPVPVVSRPAIVDRQSISQQRLQVCGFLAERDL